MRMFAEKILRLPLFLFFFAFPATFVLGQVVQTEPHCSTTLTSFGHSGSGGSQTRHKLIGAPKESALEPHVFPLIPGTAIWEKFRSLRGADFTATRSSWSISQRNDTLVHGFCSQLSVFSSTLLRHGSYGR